jgi:hypothetical protein
MKTLPTAPLMARYVVVLKGTLKFYPVDTGDVY